MVLARAGWPWGDLAQHGRIFVPGASFHFMWPKSADEALGFWLLPLWDLFVPGSVLWLNKG